MLLQPPGEFRRRLQCRLIFPKMMRKRSALLCGRTGFQGEFRTPQRFIYIFLKPKDMPRCVQSPNFEQSFELSYRVELCLPHARKLPLRVCMCVCMYAPIYWRNGSGAARRFFQPQSCKQMFGHWIPVDRIELEIMFFNWVIYSCGRRNATRQTESERSSTEAVHAYVLLTLDHKW